MAGSQCGIIKGILPAQRLRSFGIDRHRAIDYHKEKENVKPISLCTVDTVGKTSSPESAKRALPACADHRLVAIRHQ